MHPSKLVGIAVAFVLAAMGPPVQAASVLYATGVGTGPNAGVGGLYTVDPQTGAATLVATFPAFVHGGGLAYDAATDTLYATGYDNLSQSTLFKIDRFTGTATAIGHSGTGIDLQYGGLAIHPSTGVLYATGSNGLQSTGLFTVSKYTGAATLVGQAGSGCCRSLYGLGF